MSQDSGKGYAAGATIEKRRQQRAKQAAVEHKAAQQIAGQKVARGLPEQRQIVQKIG